MAKWILYYSTDWHRASADADTADEATKWLRENRCGAVEEVIAINLDDPAASDQVYFGDPPIHASASIAWETVVRAVGHRRLCGKP